MLLLLAAAAAAVCPPSCHQIVLLLAPPHHTPAGVDKARDLAVLKVNAPAALLRPVRLADSASVRVGQACLAIGNPFGEGGGTRGGGWPVVGGPGAASCSRSAGGSCCTLSFRPNLLPLFSTPMFAGFERTLTSGVVSALGRGFQSQTGSVIGGGIQTDAAGACVGGWDAGCARRRAGCSHQAGVRCQTHCHTPAHTASCHARRARPKLPPEQSTPATAAARCWTSRAT